MTTTQAVLIMGISFLTSLANYWIGWFMGRWYERAIHIPN